MIKGKIEWRRVFVVFIAFNKGIYGWRMLYYISNFSEVLSTTGYFVVSINTLLLSLVLSLFGSLAYINWEVFARAQKNGESLQEVEEYVPEYQERVAQQLRIEKEIEIARESQYQLMPLQPP